MFYFLSGGVCITTATQRFLIVDGGPLCRKADRFLSDVHLGVLWALLVEGGAAKFSLDTKLFLTESYSPPGLFQAWDNLICYYVLELKSNVKYLF